jgi:hypothetical protein
MKVLMFFFKEEGVTPHSLILTEESSRKALRYRRPLSVKVDTSPVFDTD